MKRAVVITGAQSTGNHLMTRILVDSGFIGTVDGHQVFWDEVILGDELPSGNYREYTEDSDKRFVFRGSMPKGGPGWWDIKGAVEKLEFYGYSVVMIVMHRDVFSTASSQVYKYKESIPTFEKALEEIQMAYRHIYRYDMPYVPVTYESLVFQRDATIKHLG